MFSAYLKKSTNHYCSLCCRWERLELLGSGSSFDCFSNKSTYMNPPRNLEWNPNKNNDPTSHDTTRRDRLLDVEIQMSTSRRSSSRENPFISSTKVFQCQKLDFLWKLSWQGKKSVGESCVLFQTCESLVPSWHDGINNFFGELMFSGIGNFPWQQRELVCHHQSFSFWKDSKISIMILFFLLHDYTARKWSNTHTPYQ